MANKKIIIDVSLIQRFWAKVRKGDGCWEWTASKDKKGYGQIGQMHGGKSIPLFAHRVSWEMHNGSAEGLLVCHHCDNPACVNPDHLFLGTQRDNMRDASRKGRLGGENSWPRRYPERIKRGEDHGQAKLCEADVRAIRASGETGIALAERYGVSDSVIFRAKNRKTWKHVK
jgi:hypothetical protein